MSLYTILVFIIHTVNQRIITLNHMRLKSTYQSVKQITLSKL